MAAERVACAPGEERDAVFRLRHVRCRVRVVGPDGEQALAGATLELRYRVPFVGAVVRLTSDAEGGVWSDPAPLVPLRLVTTVGEVRRLAGVAVDEALDASPRVELPEVSVPPGRGRCELVVRVPRTIRQR